jgi:acyl carrier protein
MTREEILAQVTDLLRDLLDNDALELTFETSAGEVDGWDSVTHVSLLVAVQQHFGVKFRTAELEGLRNVGHLVDLIHTRMS